MREGGDTSSQNSISSFHALHSQTHFLALWATIANRKLKKERKRREREKDPVWV